MEAESLLVDAARRVAAAVAGRGPAREAGWPEDQRRRLELLVLAVFGLELPVRVAQPPARASLLARLLGRSRRSDHGQALPATDGRSVFLPRGIPEGPLPAARHLRLLALQQAGRATRGTAAPGAASTPGLIHELYLISEAAAVERHLAALLPGLARDLPLARAAVLASRPRERRLSPREREVERLYREILRAPDVPWLPPARAPVDSLRWAEVTARRIESDHPGSFRGLARDLWSGELLPPEGGALRRDAARPDEDGAPSGTTARLPRRPRVREPIAEEDGEPGPWMVQMDEPQEHVEDPLGLSRPLDRDAGERPDDTAGSLSELPEAALVATPERARETFESDDPPESRSTWTPAGGTGIAYPEWDHRIAAYHPAGARVLVPVCPIGDARWAAQVMARRRPLFDEVRRRFEGLRPRRVPMSRQRDGEEVDLDAWIEATADMRAGGAIPDGLYRTVRPARRDVAISLLIDRSGSTEAWVSEDLRVIDVEKEALLLCCHALEALGDPHAVLAFSGEGPQGVAVWELKGFEENDAALVRRRIAALEPDRRTRAGAALRHAAAGLAARHERHRMLLLISDGKPGDVDHYEGRYGIEDMRQAVQEALGAGIACFGLAIDRQAPAYLDRIFGPGRHAALSHARQLPVALVEVLRRMVRG